MAMKTKLAQAAPEQEETSLRVDITKIDEPKITLSAEHMRFLPDFFTDVIGPTTATPKKSRCPSASGR
jgi:hypothetical protein